MAEVCYDTVAADLNIKAALYGKAGYPVYWVHPELIEGDELRCGGWPPPGGEILDGAGDRWSPTGRWWTWGSSRSG